LTEHVKLIYKDLDDEEWYFESIFQQLLVTTFFPLFLLDNNNRREKGRENKNITRVWERELSQKLLKNGCSNIVSLRWPSVYHIQFI